MTWLLSDELFGTIPRVRLTPTTPPD